MSEQIKVTHAGIEIVYVEGENQWVFTLRGRERKVESLQKAKEAIDKPPPKDKKPFERIEAWGSNRYGGTEFKILTVTSIAERQSSWSRTPEVWVTYADKDRWGKAEQKREKYSSDAVFPRNEKNDAIVAKCEQLRKQIQALEEELAATHKKLTPLKVEKEEE